MLLQALRDTKFFGRDDGYVAQVEMPVRLAPELAEIAFVRPLDRDLTANGLGRVAGFDVELDEDGEPDTLTIALSLVTDAPRVHERVADLLEGLDAPAGSRIGSAECADMAEFGKSYGLALYLPRNETDEEARLEILEACTDALEGAGIYQGSVSVKDRTALYFYGDSFNEMRAAVTFIMSTDPRCKNAYARRLN